MRARTLHPTAARNNADRKSESARPRLWCFSPWLKAAVSRLRAAFPSLLSTTAPAARALGAAAKVWLRQAFAGATACRSGCQSPLSFTPRVHAPFGVCRSQPGRTVRPLALMVSSSITVRCHRLGAGQRCGHQEQGHGEPQSCNLPPPP